MYQRQPNELQQSARRFNALRAGTIALLLFCLALIAGRVALGFWTERLVDRLALTAEDEVVKGLSLTRKACRRSDMLLVLGSSELTFQDDFHVARLFAQKPTGFSPYLIGGGYRQSIHNFLLLSGLGHDLSGKKLVLFVSPTWFRETIEPVAYRKNFSLRQAYEFAFASSVSPELQRRGARRLLELGSPGTDDPVLRGALQALASGTTLGRVRYGLLWPIGRLQVEFQRVRDDLDLLAFAYSKRYKPPRISPYARELDWDRLLSLAEREAKERTAGNPFGMDDRYYQKYVSPRLDKLKDSEVGTTWLKSTEYGDLELVLQTLKEMQAKPLFISVPVLGPYYDYKGHPASDRQAYYRKVKEMIEEAGFPVADYGDREYEPGFMQDPWHQGWKGSVYIAQTMDQFYHNRLPSTGR